MTQHLSIRAATLADAETALDLIEQLFDAPGRRPPYYTRERGLAGVRHCIESPTSDCLLAEEDGVAVGLATVYVDLLSIRRGQRCVLEELVVARDRRGGGIGARLLAAAQEWARDHGCAHLQLESGLGRKDAHRFYLAQGMDQVSYVFNRELEGRE